MFDPNRLEGRGAASWLPFPRLGLRLPIFWQVQILGWVLFALLSFPLKYSVYGSFTVSLGITLLREPLGFLLSSGLRLFYRGAKIDSRQPLRLALWVLPLSLAAGAIDALIVVGVDHAVSGANFERIAFGTFSIRSLLYLLWSFLYFWIKDQIVARKRQLALARAEAAAREAEILMLRAQVSPHFLFNALNTILAGLDRDPKALVPVVQGLADYFRYSLASRHTIFVPLGEEYDATMDYLQVEKARFRDTLVIDTHIDSQARSLQVCGVFLQPLIENALKYGHQTSPTPLRLRLRIELCKDGDGVVIEVANSGKWIEPPALRPSDDAGGNGLDTIRRRLELLYPGNHSLEILSPPEAGEVVVRLRIPTVNTSPA